jgi:hypothetical protein
MVRVMVRLIKAAVAATLHRSAGCAAVVRVPALVVKMEQLAQLMMPVMFAAGMPVAEHVLILAVMMRV